MRVGREDWYRRTTWSNDDREQFFARLERSREAFHKSQYLRIQAYCLQLAGLYEDALQLLNLLVERFGLTTDPTCRGWRREWASGRCHTERKEGRQICRPPLLASSAPIFWLG